MKRPISGRGGSILAAAVGASAHRGGYTTYMRPAAYLTTTCRSFGSKDGSNLSQPFGKGGLETSSTRAPDSSHVQIHEEHCNMGWTREQIYMVVADVAKYQQFLPWCMASVVHTHNGADNLKRFHNPDEGTPMNKDLHRFIQGLDDKSPEMCATSMDATLNVGFAFLKEKYTSEVELVPCSSIIANLQGESTLLRSLQCQWAFTPTSSLSSTEIDFLVSFEFRNPLHKSMSSLVMNNVVNLMTSSFESRCKSLHGEPSHPRVQLPKRTADFRHAAFAEHGQHHQGGLASRLLNVFNLDGVKK